MSFEVKTRVFEGPLDLLLQLITSHQLAITELSLIEIVNEYLAYVDAMEQLDLEAASEFLLIASTLIQMKARHLLPDDIPLDLDEEIALAKERDRLLSRLLAALTFKDVAAVLRYRMEMGERHVGREVGLEGVGVDQQPDAVIPVDAVGFAALAETVLSTRWAEPDVGHLDLELPSVHDAMVDLRGRMASVTTASFDEIVEHCTRKADVVAYFLALLELARWGILEVQQPEAFSTIGIRFDRAASDRHFDTVVNAEGTP
ncbi:MAG: ScpA family protein [Acidimicrobiia bacterium]